MIDSFYEWIKKRKPAPIKNKDMESFLKSVDLLKRDLEELDKLEKKVKPKLPLKPEKLDLKKKELEKKLPKLSKDKPDEEELPDVGK